MSAGRLRTIGIHAAIVVATVVGAEVLARSYDWAPPAREPVTTDGLGRARYEYSPSGIGDLAPNQDGHWVIWFHRPYHVKTNSVGLRNAEEPSHQAFRILALGDSQTFGPYLANEDTWPAWTENYLRQQRMQPDRLQVLNAGIAGYTILDELALLRDKGLSLRPALVLLAVFENDLADLRREKDGRVQRPKDGAPSRLQVALKEIGHHSAFVHVAEEVKSGIDRAAAGVDIRRGEGSPRPQPAPAVDDARYVARYGELFREMRALAATQGVPLAVIFIPASDGLSGGTASAMQPVIRGLTGEAGIPYLDLTPIFAAERDPITRLYLLQKEPGGGYAGNGHLSREGNAVIGRAVAEWLTQSGALPQETR
jgi:lysophospholipase L1-like esterase